jgi:hypothetical protein
MFPANRRPDAQTFFRRDHRMATESLTRDEERLAELGYKQELKRGWSSFSNFAISF